MVGRDRPLRPDEKVLWEKVTKTLVPKANASTVTSNSAGRATTARPFLPKPVAARPSKVPASRGSVHDAGDPREPRKVARGRTEIDATLDLHGYRQLEAEIRLTDFLRRAKAKGHRVVLVITGKGPPQQQSRPFGAPQRGVLRHRFLEWVDQPPLRDLVTTVSPAHIRHGGRGAFYVFLRRR